MMRSIRHILFFIVLWMPTAVLAQSYRLNATIDPATAQTGDVVRYTLRVEYEKKAPPQPLPPQFDPAWGFSQPGRPEVGQQTTMINAQVSHTVQYTWEFQVSKEGTYKIPGTGFDLNGNPYRSNSVTLTVTKSTAATLNLPPELQGKVVAPQVRGNRELQKALTGVLFILPVVETTTPYNGQQVLVSYHLFVDEEGLRKLGAVGNPFGGMEVVQTPSFEQFLKEVVFDVPQRLNFKESIMGGKKYVGAAIYQVAVTPTKTGKLTAEPFALNISLALRQRTRPAARDPFTIDPFNDPLFESFNPFGSQTQVIALSPRLEFDVKPLPAEGKPADFSGAVGRFQMATSVDKKQVTAEEDIVRVQVKVEGQGDATTVAPPQFPQVDGLTVLEEPKATTDRRTNEKGELVSSKVFDYAVRPTRAGKVQIPPVAVSAFNPQDASYYVAKSEPVELTVAAPKSKPVALVAPATQSSPAEAAAAQPAGEQPQQLNQDLNYIHVGSLAAVEPGALTGEGPLFVLLLLFPPAALAAAYVAGRRRAAYAANRGFYRDATAGAVARKHLKHAERLLKKDDRVGFFEELARGFRGFFANKFNMEAAGLTIEEIEEKLRGRDVDEGTVRSARSLLEQCDTARYAPVRPDPSSMQRAYSEAANILNRLEKI